MIVFCPDMFRETFWNPSSPKWHVTPRMGLVGPWWFYVDGVHGHYIIQIYGNFHRFPIHCLGWFYNHPCCRNLLCFKRTHGLGSDPKSLEFFSIVLVEEIGWNTLNVPKKKLKQTPTSNGQDSQRPCSWPKKSNNPFFPQATKSTSFQDVFEEDFIQEIIEFPYDSIHLVRSSDPKNIPKTPNFRK